MSLPGRIVALLFVIVVGATSGWFAGTLRRAPVALGPVSIDGPTRNSAPHAVETRESVLARLAAVWLDLTPPPPDAAGALRWQAWASDAELALKKAGLELDAAGEAETLARLAAAGEAPELAVALDALAEAHHRADQAERRDFATRLARSLDPEPTRDALRAARLASDNDAIRVLAADLDAQKLPTATVRLLGLALVRCGEIDDALDVWRTASLEAPGDEGVHRLLAWLLLDPDRGDAGEARRHLAVLHALRPESAVLRAELEASEP